MRKCLVKKMKLPKFCVKCGIKLSEGLLGLSPQYFTFEDGNYCPKCAKIKVEEARKKI